MKILILLTSHRHNDEYKLYGLYLEKCIQLSNMVDIYIHSNCINTIYQLINSFVLTLLIKNNQYHEKTRSSSCTYCIRI